jgi:uncharacterized protein YdeI (YjbR/CyaY-like superfamily)
VNDRQEAPIVSFESAQSWRAWLAKNHGASKGVWLRLFKKASGKPTVTYDEALDDALCFGWIDGQLQKYDDESWLRKFTPRRPGSVWSKRNREHVERLIKTKQMQPSGLAVIELSKQDGQWDAAYDSAKNMEIPEDFLQELAKDKQAEAFFRTLNKANLYAIAWRLQTAKRPETRQRRMAAILTMLAEGKKLH